MSQIVDRDSPNSELSTRYGYAIRFVDHQAKGYMSTIFLSYASETRATAKEIADALEVCDHRVFIDKQSIMGGDRWEETIEDELNRSRAVIIVYDRHWLASNWCFYEGRRAVYLQKTLIPLLIDDSAVQEPIGRYQAIDFRDDSAVGRQQALQQLETTLSAKGVRSRSRSTSSGRLNPYKGLSAYTSDDHDIFFGRSNRFNDGRPSDLDGVVSFAENLRRQRSLGFIYGPSGSGKSSLIAAGLLPTLRGVEGIPSDVWIVPDPAKMRIDPFGELAEPLGEEAHLSRAEADHGDTKHVATEKLRSRFDQWDGGGVHPLVEIAKAARRNSNRPDARLLLVIDQFEQLLVTDDNETASRFIHFLHEAASSKDYDAPIIIVAIRVDFIEQFQTDYPDIGIHESWIVNPLDRASLADVIIEPARRNGFVVEQPLVHSLVEDTIGGAGLPLLSYCLEAMAAESLSPRVLSTADYQRIGGMTSIISERAEKIYSSSLLTEGQDRQLRQVFLDLAKENSANSEQKWVRRPVRWDGVGSDIRPVLQSFAAQDARLLTLRTENDHSTNGPQPPTENGLIVEVAHEAIFTSWDRLNRWLIDAQEQMRVRDDLDSSATSWRQEPDDRKLWEGGRLARAIDLQEAQSLTLSQESIEFLNASLHKFERKQRRTQWRTVAIAMTMTLIAAFAGLMAVQFQRTTTEAEALDLQSEANSLASVGRGYLKAKPALSAALGLEALNLTDRPVRNGAGVLALGYASAQPGLVDTTTLEGHTRTVFGVAYSPDGTQLATTSYDQTVKLWDPTTGTNTATLEGHTDTVFGVAYSPDGTQLATTSADQTVKLWDPTTGTNTTTLEGHTDTVLGVAYSPDGTQLATTSHDQTVKLWDLPTGTNTTTLEGHTRRVVAVAYSPDGTQLATTGYDQTVKLWDLPTGTNTTTLEGHTRTVEAVAYSPDGTQLATTSADQTVKLWDLPTGTNTATLEGHIDTVFAVAYNPDGTQLATTSADQTVKLWDPTTGTNTTTLEGHIDTVFGVAYNPDGTQLATTSYDQTAKLWDLTTGTNTATLEGHTRTVFAVAYNPDGTQLATTSYDQTAKLWDLTTGTNTATLEGHTRTVLGVAYSPDGTQLATTSADQTVKLWDLTTGTNTTTLEGHTDTVFAVAYSPDGTQLATTSHDQTVKLWDLATGTNTATLEGHADTVEAVAYSPDGTQLATTSHDQTVKLWDLATGTNTATLEGHTRTVEAVAYSPDGTQLATISADQTVKLWDPTTGTNTTTLERHTDTVEAVAYSPDGTQLATTSADQTVKLWDLTTGTNTTTLEGHTDTVFAVAYSPDGTQLATTSSDQTIKLWQIEPTTWLCDQIAPHVSRRELQQEMSDRAPTACPNYEP